ncbi:phage major capsid protein [Kocuria sp. HSID16901]|nr:phage major capsid protein [Kocuria sp. HSID16901]
MQENKRFMCGAAPFLFNGSATQFKESNIMVQLTTNGPKALYPDATFTPADIVPDALINQITTPTVPIEGDQPVVRIPYVTEDPTVGFVPEGTEIPASDTQLSELLVSTRKLAVLQPISREAVSYAGTESIISNSMRRAVTIKADNALLNNPDNPTGLLNITGITDAGAMNAADLDVLSDAITTIETHGATTTNIVMDPASWGALRNLKTGKDSAQLLLGNPAEQTSKQLFGIPVTVSNLMPTGTILALDKNDILSSLGDIQVAKSTDAAFTRDQVLYRVMWRFGFAPIHPERIAKITLTV